MRAVGFRSAGPLGAEGKLADITLPDPVAGADDLLVRIQAIAVNPVDTKVRSGAIPLPPADWHVLGWDAVGIVQAIGADATGFSVGDAVFYSGSLGRPGTNAELHVVDHRLVGHAPTRIAPAEAAALPLTAVTAWETLFDRLCVDRPVPGGRRLLLVIGGAGGVGSVAIQLARLRSDLTVIATASRPETRDWVTAMGADHVVDHSRPLAPQVEALGLGQPEFVFSTTETGRHLADIAALIAPQGRFALIDDPKSVDIVGFKMKSVSVHWELMYTRSLFRTTDMAEQGRILGEVAGLVDSGRLRTTLGAHYGPIDAANLSRAHAALESGRTIGKIVLEGFA